MKLYTYTTEQSLPRMALKGMRDGFVLLGDLSFLAELMGESEEKNLVALEVDASGLDSIMLVDGETVEGVADSAAHDAAEAGEDAGEARDRIYNADISTIEKALEVFGEVENREVIPASRITVLGRLKSLTYPEGIDEPAEVKFKGTPKPLKAFQQPIVTRLLRSIFLPKHKLYGAGRRGPAVGFISRFLPKQEEVEVEEEVPPDIVAEVSLVWAAGKTFRRGMRGAFGKEAGDAIAQLVSMRAGREPGKYLGSGMKGAVYALGEERVLKVTMDGNEIYAAANLIGVQHPNLSLVHDVFVVTDGENGSGFIIRDSIDTTLNEFDEDAAAVLNGVMNDALDSLIGKVGSMVARFRDVDPDILAVEVDKAIDFLRRHGCKVNEWILLDIADAFRELKHLGIIGIDFDSRNVGIINGKKPRAVVFDYGMTKSPPVHVDVVSLSEMRM